MDAKQYQIKSNGWHDVTLTGDILTGDTYACKQFIKTYLGGKWDATSKAWRVDLEMVAKHTAANGTTLWSN